MVNVELNNGSVALVVEESSRFKLRPKVLLILNEDKNLVEERVIDLSEMPTDVLSTVLSIRAIISPNDYQINSKKYYQQGIIQKGFANK